MFKDWISILIITYIIIAYLYKNIKKWVRSKILSDIVEMSNECCCTLVTTVK